MVTEMIPASFFDTIKDKDGFAVIHQNKMRYSADSTVSDDAFDMGIDECLNGLIENGINFQSHSVGDGDAVVLVIGEPAHTEKEYRLLERLLKQSNLTLEESIMFSLTGIPLDEKSPKLPSYDSTTRMYEKMNKRPHASIDEVIKFKSTIQIPKDLAEKLDEFVLTKLDLKTLKKSTEIHSDAITSSIVSSLVKQFLRFTYDYQAEDITGEDMLDITFMSNFPKCNICMSFDCEHVDIVLHDKSILSDLKKDGIIPIHFDFVEFLKNSNTQEMDMENKSKFKQKKG